MYNTYMKTVFLGTPDFVNPVLNKLQEKYEVAECIRKPLSVDSVTIEHLKSLSPDLFVVAAYGQILPQAILDIPKLGAINIHPSLLPKYRGSTPIQTAIRFGDKTTGVSFIKMDEKMDHGPILFQLEEVILETDTFESLANRLFEKSANELEEVITRFIQDQTGTPQKDINASFTKMLKRDDGLFKIDNPPPRESLERMIRAYYPWPGVWTNYALVSNEIIIKLLPNKMIQVEGKNPMSYKDFMNGYPHGEEFLRKLSLI